MKTVAKKLSKLDLANKSANPFAFLITWEILKCPKRKIFIFIHSTKSWQYQGQLSIPNKTHTAPKESASHQILAKLLSIRRSNPLSIVSNSNPKIFSSLLRDWKHRATSPTWSQIIPPIPTVDNESAPFEFTFVSPGSGWCQAYV